MARFTSRKFWLAFGAAVTAAAAGEWGAFVSVVLGYIGVEGALDARHTPPVVTDMDPGE